MAGDREHCAVALRQLRGAGGARGRAGGHQLGQEVAGQPGPGERISERGAGGQVEQPGSRGERQLGHVSPAESPHDPLGHVQPARRGPRRGLVLGQPAQLRHRAQRAGGQAGRLGEAVGAEVVGELARLLVAAGVVPRDHRREHGGRGHPAAHHSPPCSSRRRRTPAPPPRRPARRAPRRPPRRTGRRGRPPLPWARAARAWPIGRGRVPAPARSTTTALQAEVPTSMPSRRSVTERLPLPRRAVGKPPRLPRRRAGRRPAPHGTRTVSPRATRIGSPCSECSSAAPSVKTRIAKPRSSSAEGDVSIRSARKKRSASAREAIAVQPVGVRPRAVDAPKRDVPPQAEACLVLAAAKPRHSSRMERSLGSWSSTSSTPSPMACGSPARHEQGIARLHLDGVERIEHRRCRPARGPSPRASPRSPRRGSPRASLRRGPPCR